MISVEASTNALQENISLYNSESLKDKYSFYGLYPEEKYIAQKYFKTPAKILDLACGGGRTTVPLYEMGFEIKGVDLSATLVNAARKRFPYLHFEEGSYTAIKEPDNSYDIVLLSHNGIDYTLPADNRIKAIKECHRVLKTEGLFVLSTHNIRSLFFSPIYFLSLKRFSWMMKNFYKAFRSRTYIKDVGLNTHYIYIPVFIKEVCDRGFKLEEVVTYKAKMSLQHKFPRLLRWMSPYVHLVFRKIV